MTPLKFIGLGKTMATRAALQAFEMTGEDIWRFVDEHQAALRRKLSDVDVSSLEPGCQLLSTYKLNNGIPIGIVTESDFSRTTVFLVES